MRNYISLQQIPQDLSKHAMKKHTEKIAKELKEVKGKLDPYSSKVEKNFKKSAASQDHTKGDQAMNILLSCPECPFNTLSASTMTQHIYKHSVGRPYLCPYCSVRDSVKRLHIAHQKRQHPNMKVVVNNTRLEESEVRSDSSLWTSECVSSLSRPSNVQQICKNYQIASSANANAGNKVNDSDTVEIGPRSHMSTAQTEISLQFLEKSESKSSTLYFPDFYAPATLLTSPTITQKTGKRQRVSISHEDQDSKRPFIGHSSTPSPLNVSEANSESTHQKSFTGRKMSLRSKKR